MDSMLAPHPLAEELTRLFNPRKCNFVSPRGWDSGNTSPVPSPSTPPPQDIRPRLGSDGREEYANLSWQPPCTTYKSNPTITTSNISVQQGSTVNPLNLDDINTGDVLQQLGKLAAQIGYSETMNYLQLMHRLTAREQVLQTCQVPAPTSPVSQTSATSFVPVQPIQQVATFPMTNTAVFARPVMPSSSMQCWHIQGPQPASSPQTIPTNAMIDKEALLTRPSRWVSAGLPTLSRSLPVGDVECAKTLPLPCNGHTQYVPQSTTPVSTSAPALTSDWQQETKLLRNDHTTTKQLLFEILRRNSNKSRSRQDYVCVFCRNNGEAKAIYTSHRLKDVNGAIQCPVLRIYECPTCHASGDNAHTLKYCPKAKDTALRVPLCSPRKSNGKIRILQHDE